MRIGAGWVIPRMLLIVSCISWNIQCLVNISIAYQMGFTRLQHALILWRMYLRGVTVLHCWEIHWVRMIVLCSASIHPARLLILYFLNLCFRPFFCLYQFASHLFFDLGDLFLNLNRSLLRLFFHDCDLFGDWFPLMLPLDLDVVVFLHFPF